MDLSLSVYVNICIFLASRIGGRLGLNGRIKVILLFLDNRFREKIVVVIEDESVERLVTDVSRISRCSKMGAGGKGNKNQKNKKETILQNSSS